MSEREKAFESARTLGEAGKIDEALEALTNYTSEPETEYTVSEMEVINTIITEKLTSVSFEEKKDACNICITLLEGVKLVKDGEWLSLYSESVYEAFSRMSICARDEERQLFWNRLKVFWVLPFYYEQNLFHITSAEVIYTKKCRIKLLIYECLELVLNSSIRPTSEMVWSEMEDTYDPPVGHMVVNVLIDKRVTTFKQRLLSVHELGQELFYEINLAAKKVWRDKNYPERLAIYVLYAKLCKSWLDVADEESYKLCETEAKEAKFFGKGTLDDDQWRESNRSIEQIKKLIGDALHERELIDDESD